MVVSVVGEVRLVGRGWESGGVEVEEGVGVGKARKRGRVGDGGGGWRM